MRKLFASIAVLGLMASPAAAIDLDFGGGLGGGFNHSFSEHTSGSGGVALTGRTGGGQASASNESYGMSEGWAGGDFDGMGVANGNNGQGQGGGGIDANFRYAGENIAGSGSLSNAAASSSGNGSAFAGSAGAGFGEGTVGVISGGGTLTFSD